MRDLFKVDAAEQKDIADDSLRKKIISVSSPLDDLVSFKYGFKTGDDEKFIHPTKMYAESKPFIRSGDVGRYYRKDATEFVWYVPEKMIKHKSTARPGEAARFEAEKIIVSRMGKALASVYDEGGLYVKDAMLLVAKNGKLDLNYILGLLNSKLMEYIYTKYFVTIDVLKNALLSLPIVVPKTALQKLRAADIANLARALMDSSRNISRSQTDKDREYYEGLFSEYDRRLNLQVYALYGLSESEISIVEAKYSHD